MLGRAGAEAKFGGMLFLHTQACRPPGLELAGKHQHQQREGDEEHGKDRQRHKQPRLGEYAERRWPHTMRPRQRGALILGAHQSSMRRRETRCTFDESLNAGWSGRRRWGSVLHHLCHRRVGRRPPFRRLAKNVFDGGSRSGHNLKAQTELVKCP
jgi:hypothetical protein